MFVGRGTRQGTRTSEMQRGVFNSEIGSTDEYGNPLEEEALLAEESALPVDPSSDRPTRPCPCGSTEFTPDGDVMDVWATASLSPQIAGQRLENPELYQRVFPFTLRPQAHEIIRTWAFYTIVKAWMHEDALPWKHVVISGWILDPDRKRTDAWKDGIALTAGFEERDVRGQRAGAGRVIEFHGNMSPAGGWLGRKNDYMHLHGIVKIDAAAFSAVH